MFTARKASQVSHLFVMWPLDAVVVVDFVGFLADYMLRQKADAPNQNKIIF